MRLTLYYKRVSLPKNENSVIYFLTLMSFQTHKIFIFGAQNMFDEIRELSDPA